MSTGRASFLMVVLPNGQVLAAGGDDSGGFLTSAELYNPATGTWTATGSMPIANDNGGVLLQNGKVFNLVELYNPTTGTWSTTAQDSIEAGGSVALLPSGDVFAGGGIQGNASITPRQTSGPTFPRLHAPQSIKVASLAARCSALGKSWSPAASPRCPGARILQPRRTE